MFRMLLHVTFSVYKLFQKERKEGRKKEKRKRKKKDGRERRKGRKAGSKEVLKPLVPNIGKKQP